MTNQERIHIGIENQINGHCCFPSSLSQGALYI
jgi:hypothetical protein